MIICVYKYAQQLTFVFYNTFRISETPCIDNLIASQQETESETTPLHGGSSLSFQATEAPEVIEYDEDVLPPSPVPLNNSRYFEFMC